MFGRRIKPELIILVRETILILLCFIVKLRRQLLMDYGHSSWLLTFPFCIDNEYSSKSKSRSKETVKLKGQASYVYGERMFMSKYKSKPKFLENLNSTLSPKKEKVLLSNSCSSSQSKLYKNLAYTKRW